MVKTLLLELNDEVKGTAVDENPMELISRSPEFFSAFSCVVATDLPEPALLKLASLLWEKKIPLCVARAYGMTGMWRNVLPEVCIIESRPEYAKENYRIASTFPQLEAFAAQYDLDTCKHPHLPLTEVPAGPGKYVDSQGRPVVPKAHSHTPAFVLLIKALEKWRASHMGSMPKTSAEKDALRELIDEMQVSETRDEENFVEAKQLARHAYAPFEIPSEVRAILSDPKVDDDSTCVEPFWLIMRALKRFVASEGAARDGVDGSIATLPLSGNLPNMHADTKSYIELQNIYREQAARDCAAVTAHAERILEELGQPAGLVSQQDISLVCKNAASLRIVRTTSLEEEYKGTNTADWSWALDMPEELPHNLYVLMRAADRFRTNYGAFPGSQTPYDEADLVRYKEVLSTLCAEMGLATNVITEDMAHEVVRCGGSELHSIASVMGGVGAMEVTKILMKQFVPGNGTFIFNGVTGKNAMCNF